MGSGGFIKNKNYDNIQNEYLFESELIHRFDNNNEDEEILSFLENYDMFYINILINIKKFVNKLKSYFSWLLPNQSV